MVARGDPREMNDEQTHVITRRDLHDLMNRVAVIKGYAQLLERQMMVAPIDHDRASRRVTTLRSEIERLEKILIDLPARFVAEQDG